MNLLVVLLSMWVLSISLFFVIINARTEPAMSSISGSPLNAKRQFLSGVSADTEAECPVMSGITIVHHQDLNQRILIALIISSTLLGGILLFLLCYWIRRQKSLKNSGKKGQKSLEAAKGVSLSPISVKFNSMRIVGRKGSVAIFDYQLLEAATNSFSKSNVLGEGGSDNVYKACLDENLLAAVKKIDSQAPEREFENEVNWLSKIQHQNIIKLLGYCVHGESRFLVFELMENGSLETQLHGPTRGSTLSWHLRLRIAADIARGLETLHEHCNPPVVHRDLKSSNVLLDSDYSAKLSDFGLAVTCGIQNKNIKLSGTLGYVAPEYLQHGKLTDKSDVYAFGVVLLELLTGRRPMESIPSGDCQSIVAWAMPQLTDRSKLPHMVDPVIRNNMDLRHLYQVAAVAVLCVQPEPSYRPLITDVLHSLIPLVPVELGGSLRVTEPVSSDPVNRQTLHCS